MHCVFVLVYLFVLRLCVHTMFASQRWLRGFASNYTNTLLLLYNPCLLISLSTTTKLLPMKWQSCSVSLQFTCVQMEHATQVNEQHNFDSFRLPPQLSSLTPCHSGTRLVRGWSRLSNWCNNVQCHSRLMQSQLYKSTSLAESRAIWLFQNQGTGHGIPPFFAQ